MADKRCFVQFSHPGKEHGPKSGRDWNRSKLRHRRKFMRLTGEWIEGDGTKRSGDMWAWGEWEPESDLIGEFNASETASPYPRYLWKPHYVPRKNYRGLHNTDPFIFGKRFLYSNCRQKKSGSLKQLARGSVVAFGSGMKIAGERKWVLDTVLVVKDSFLYDPLNPLEALKNKVPNPFSIVTGRPLTADHNLSDEPEERRLRLYRGATPDDRVERMFSFFPAAPEGGDGGFPRPLIDLPSEYFNPKNWQAQKGLVIERSHDELYVLWHSLVEQVLDAGLVLGTYAALPLKRRVR